MIKPEGAFPAHRYLVLKRRFDDFDEFAAQAPRWDFEFRQLDRGRFSGGFVQVVGAEAQVGRARMDRVLERRGSTPHGFYSFVVHMDRAGHHTFHGRQVQETEMVVMPPGSDISGVSQPAFDVYNLSFSEERLAEIAQTLGQPDPLAGPQEAHLVSLPGPALNALRRHLDTLHSTLGTCPDGSRDSWLDRQLLFELPRRVLRTLVTAKPANHTSLYRVRDRALRRAQDFIEETADRAPSVREVCQASGASERTLQHAFRERYGITPGAYVRAVRLNGSRKDLRRADPASTKVSDVANAWGFWHMGQFAADYRRQFGELPSNTLAAR